MKILVLLMTEPVKNIQASVSRNNKVDTFPPDGHLLQGVTVAICDAESDVERHTATIVIVFLSLIFP